MVKSRAEKVDITEEFPPVLGGRCDLFTFSVIFNW